MLNYSLLCASAGFFDKLPAELVSNEQRRHLLEAAELFPPILRFALECRLNSNTQVDLQMCLQRDKDDLTSVYQWFDKLIDRQTEDETRFMDFLSKWSTSKNSYYEDIIEIFLELDVRTTAFGVPLLFLQLEPTLTKDKKKTFCDYLITETLGERKVFLPILDKIIDLCPEHGNVAYLGMQFSRDVNVLRVNIKTLTAESVLLFLKAIGYQWISESLADCIEFVYEHADRVTLCLDISTGVLPGIGFECFWNEFSAEDVRWVAFKSVIIEKGLCEPQKIQAVESWNKNIFPGDIPHWPEHLWIESLQRSDLEFVYLKQTLSHIKVSYKLDKPLEFKAYLGYLNLWMNLA
ncbi:hypothetical protein MUY27_05745 [Mucilaginibacter sp. RS28]|uniref:Uncharacterized protein n=1 Tax=Mucilaginibacter straminoryzae TaxID=2932774 RepID=A0A9X1X1N6_9SPHI|nr:hypothetical protein [Mucilaginibacter straminoryzae]MCJ8209201.1 hypothetical protein [Mucilaginibacter straminoryzae]